MSKSKFFFLSFLFCGRLVAQCDVTEKMMADGTMYYHAETLLFYKTSQFELSGNIVTDKEHFFLRLKPMPYPEKPKGNKLKDDLIIKLVNDTTYTLSLYDAHYSNKDSSFLLLYLFNKKDINAFVSNEVKEVKLKLEDEPQTYVFRLHKTAIRDQINCFRQKNSKY